MYCVFLGRATATNAPGAGSVNTAAIADNAVTSAKLTYPLTTFSSTGIDDNATSNAMTIESSERVQFTRPRSNTLGDAALEIKPSDTVVGVGFRMENTNNDIVVEKSSPSGSEAEIFRIRSGGGIAIGGTGDANTLSDYEEGTWTPGFTNFSGSGGESGPTSPEGYYTKIGDLVFASFYVDVPANGDSSAINISSLPFSAKDVPTMQFGGSITRTDAAFSVSLATVVSDNSNYIHVTRSTSSANLVPYQDVTGKFLTGIVVYKTA
jgi:hypothetical protein